MGTSISSEPSRATAEIGAAWPGASSARRFDAGQPRQVVQIAAEILDVPRARVLQQHLELAAGRNVQFAADLAHTFDEIDHPAHFVFRVADPPRRPAALGKAQRMMVSPSTPALARTPLPDLFADEGRERMQRAQQHFQGIDQGAARAAFRRVAGPLGLQHRLREFQIPIAELVPGELIQGVGDDVEAVLGEAGLDTRQHGGEACLNPSIGQAELRAGGPRRIPDFPHSSST